MNFFRQSYLVLTNKSDNPTPVQTQRDGQASGTNMLTCPICRMAWRTWTDEDGRFYKICVQGHREYIRESS
jgi:hypothetical protein